MNGVGFRQRSPNRARVVDGILPHIRKLAHERTIFVCDDTERPDDARLADAIAEQLKLTQVIVAPTQPTDFNRQGRILVPPDMPREQLFSEVP
jgi:hypothetical protein